MATIGFIDYLVKWNKLTRVMFCSVVAGRKLDFFPTRTSPRCLLGGGGGGDSALRLLPPGRPGCRPCYCLICCRCCHCSHPHSTASPPQVSPRCTSLSQFTMQSVPVVRPRRSASASIVSVERLPPCRHCNAVRLSSERSLLLLGAFAYDKDDNDNGGGIIY
jgi:hypothetical protein